MNRLHSPRLRMPPAWDIRRGARHVYLSYRGWTVARFSVTRSSKIVAREIVWHIATLSALKESFAALN